MSVRAAKWWLLCTCCASVGVLLSGCDFRPTAKISATGGGGSAKEKAKERLRLPSHFQGEVRIAPRFQDQAMELGICFQFMNDAVPERFAFVEVMGGGLGWGDFDLDGYYDLYVVNGKRLEEKHDPAPHMDGVFRNEGGTKFADMSEAGRVRETEYGQGIAIGDFDADGFCDIFVANYGRSTLLWNQGDGTFVDESVSAGFGKKEWSAGGAWFDADGDGDLDLYVVNYLDAPANEYKKCVSEGKGVYCGVGEYRPVADRVYVNQGEGRFVDGTAELGFKTVPREGMSVVIVDLDDDLKPEVYVANDSTPNFLFTRGENRPVGSEKTMYVEMGGPSGSAISDMGDYESSMGIACADFDGDLLPDIYLTHIYDHKNTLYQNVGDLHFEDVSWGRNVAATSLAFTGFGDVVVDYDRDGDMDLFISNGHIKGPNVRPWRMTQQMLQNDGTGWMNDISFLGGEYFQKERLGRGAAGVDFDNDGDVDLSVSHMDAPVAVLVNETECRGNHWIGFSLRGRNRETVVGGRVVVKTAAGTRVQHVVSGGSYEASGDPRLVFGLGETAEVEKVEIHWPSGRVDDYVGMLADRYWEIREAEKPEEHPEWSKATRP